MELGGDYADSDESINEEDDEIDDDNDEDAGGFD